MHYAGHAWVLSPAECKSDEMLLFFLWTNHAQWCLASMWGIRLPRCLCLFAAPWKTCYWLCIVFGYLYLPIVFIPVKPLPTLPMTVLFWQFAELFKTPKISQVQRMYMCRHQSYTPLYMYYHEVNCNTCIYFNLFCNKNLKKNKSNLTSFKWPIIQYILHFWVVFASNL